ncbi:hypothetical protein GBA52_010570 [Prunus armeniaca]|nr:hypothetical protein GBA52_010570 [Prunus armeniaca]
MGLDANVRVIRVAPDEAKTFLDGTKFESTRDRDEALTIKLGEGQVVKGLDHGVISMKKGEIALFTLPAELGYGVVGGGGSVVTSNVAAQFKIELVPL